MIELENRDTWPAIGSLWRHYNGNFYEVLMYSNIETDRQAQYPTTIIYKNKRNQKVYSRPLVEWERSMTKWEGFMPQWP
jgi:hypothetical protein